MKIRTQFILTLTLFGLILVYMTVSLFATNRQVERLNRQVEEAQNIERVALELSSLSNDYLLHHGIVQRTRWEDKFSMLSNALANIVPAGPEQKSLVDQIKASQKRLDAIFNSVVSTLENPSQPRETPAELEYIRISWSRMEIQNQGLIFDASLLTHQISQQVARLKQSNLVLISILVGIFGAYMITNYVMIYRRVLRSLVKLQAGTQVIGSGTLTYIFEEKGADEIGELSRALNQMTNDLREVTASKTDLEMEIAERKRAEEITRRQNAVLAGINRIFHEAFTCQTEEELDRVCLEVAKQVTGSPYGFIVEIDHLGMVLKDITINDPGFEAFRLEDEAKHGQKQLTGLEIQGIYRRVIQVGKGFFTNSPASHPDYSEPPAGHPPLVSFLGIPLIQGEEIMGMVGLANREGGYGPEELQSAESLAPAIVQAFISKRTEDARQAYAVKLERSNQALEDFAFIASHDLREPLRKVQSFGERLQSVYSHALGEDGQDYIQRMQGAAQRMNSMLDGLLTYSRLSTQIRPFVEVDLKAVAREVLLDLEVRIHQTGGQVEIGDLPLIEADPIQMRQLLQNLVGNALKFHRTDDPPRVRIYSMPCPDNQVALIVEDNGIGFNVQLMDQLFKPFRRLHGRSVYEGSGMGLAICRKIVERHGGSIFAESQPEKGSTFTVKLPYTQAGS